ncbi:hypothetical protein TWF730_004113 [Orbilia blumenaviensis]|uniref:Uncharacterized protein n=1 Tax=Orbilia blumenaviensis TaxID=1796055 RepID=A0AAV9U5X9_9PEZI
MSHNPSSDNFRPHEPFPTSIQSINFASQTPSSSSPASSSNPFHFGASPTQQPHSPDPFSRESIGAADRHQGKRIFRPNPLLQRPEDAREKRHNLLLKKLQIQRENRAIQARGGEDEMLRMIYLSEKNRWESSQERAALAMSSWKAPVGDDEEPSPAGAYDPDMTMVELMADIEEQELQDIISRYQLPDPMERKKPHQNCAGCGSDEILESSTEVVCFNCGMGIDR